MSRIVVKVGGAVASRSAEAVLELARENEVVVVHGAGPQISVEMARAGIPVEFVGGRRVTTAEGIEIVRASLQVVNTELWAELGPRAVPFFGTDIGLRAEPIPELGLVGEPVIAELPLLRRMIEQGKLPVIAPLAAGPLNVNADDAAAAIAVGVHADRLLFLTDVEGFLLDGEVVDSLDVPTAEELHGGGTLDPTILPKLGAAITAARHGVTAFIGRTVVRAERGVEPLVKEPAA
jgi:acetylglutamate kinase